MGLGYSSSFLENEGPFGGLPKKMALTAPSSTPFNSLLRAASLGPAKGTSWGRLGGGLWKWRTDVGSLRGYRRELHFCLESELAEAWKLVPYPFIAQLLWGGKLKEFSKRVPTGVCNFGRHISLKASSHTSSSSSCWLDPRVRRLSEFLGAFSLEICLQREVESSSLWLVSSCTLS